MGVAGQQHAPAVLPPGKTRYPLYRRLGRPQGRSGRVRKISPLPGFDPRTVQPVASRYTDCAIPAPDPTGDDRKCSCHPSCVGNYHAYSRKMYLLPNITPFLQPMEQGMMAVQESLPAENYQTSCRGHRS